jgi:hypothetical protein
VIFALRSSSGHEHVEQGAREEAGIPTVNRTTILFVAHTAADDETDQLLSIFAA